MTEGDLWSDVWCDYELRRLPRGEFELTVEHGLVHVHSTLGVPPHSTTGLPVQATAALQLEGMRESLGDGGWSVPLIEELPSE